MSASYPSSVKSFTAKTDLVDDVMAVDVNDLQNEVAAIESDLLSGPQVLKSINVFTSWNKIPWTAIYVSATSIKFTGMNVAYYFPVGCKVRITQTTLKYFYVISATYSGGDTTLVLAAGTDYSVANAAITEPLVSYSETAHGFPDRFNFTPVWSSTGTQPAIVNGTLTGYFWMRGPCIFQFVQIDMGSSTTYGTGNWQIGQAITTASIRFLGMLYMLDSNVATPYVGQGVIGGTVFNLIGNAINITATQPFTWASGDRLILQAWYEL